MGKKTKIALTGSLTMLTAGIGSLLYAGNYLYNLALNKQANKDAIFTNPSTNNQIPDKDRTDINKKGDSSNFFDTIHYQDVFLDSDDGLKLHAYQFLNYEHDYVIIVHGYTSEGKLMHASAKHFYEQGYNLLLPDLRGHGQSEGDYIAMGWLDRLDIINWIKYLIDNDSKVKIILYGVSMGAATVMNVTGEKLPVNVIAAIEDCGFTSTWEMFSYQLKEMYNLPSRPFLDIANIVTQIRADYSFGKAEAIEQVKKSTTPTLFIHGDKDRFVPFKMLNQLYQSANCPKEKLVIKGAGHAQCEKIGGQVYWSKIDSFIRKYQD